MSSLLLLLCSTAFLLTTLLSKLAEQQILTNGAGISPIRLHPGPWNYSNPSNTLWSPWSMPPNNSSNGMWQTLEYICEFGNDPYATWDAVLVMPNVGYDGSRCRPTTWSALSELLEGGAWFMCYYLLSWLALAWICLLAPYARSSWLPSAPLCAWLSSAALAASYATYFWYVYEWARYAGDRAPEPMLQGQLTCSFVLWWSYNWQAWRRSSANKAS